MNMQRILVIRASAIGDFVVNLPTLVAVQKMHPCARFTLVGNPSALDLAREFAAVENIYSIETQPWSRLFYEPVSEMKFDSAIVWMKDPTVAANLGLSGIPNVTRADPFPSYGHAADHLLRTFGLDRPSLPDLWQGQTDDIIVHPTSGSPQKIWPHFDSLLGSLSTAVVLQGNSPPQFRRGEPRRSLGWGGVVQENSFDQHHSGASLTASPYRARASRRHPSSSEEGCLRILEELSLIEVSRHLRRCRAYIGNDSGITHLAAYLGCPTIALFGPTDPRVWGPIGRRVRIIWKSKLEDITVNEVLLALRGGPAGKNGTHS